MRKINIPSSAGLFSYAQGLFVVLVWAVLGNQSTPQTNDFSSLALTATTFLYANLFHSLTKRLSTL